MKDLVLIAGMHRSGTSALTGSLNQLGFSLGKDVIPAAPDNPAGFWENSRIVHFHDDLLTSLGSSWYDPLPLKFSGPKLNSAAKKLKKLLDSEFAGDEMVAVKDPRICRFLQLWQAALTDTEAQLSVIIPLRQPVAVAKSLNERNNFPVSFGVFLWLRYVADAIKGSFHLPRVVTEFEGLIEDPVNEITTALQKLGLDADFSARRTKAAKEHIREDLRHHANLQELGSRANLSDIELFQFATRLHSALRKEDWHSAEEIISDFEQFALRSPLTTFLLSEYESRKARKDFRRLNDDVVRVSDYSSRVVKELSGEINRVSNVVVDRDSEIATLAQSIGDHKTEISRLEQSLAAQLDETLRLTAENRKASADITRILTDVDALIESRAKVQKDLDDVLSTSHGLVAERDELAVEVRRVSSLLVERNSDVAQRDVDLEKLRLNISNLQIVVQDGQSTNDQLKVLNSELEETYNRTREQLEQSVAWSNHLQADLRETLAEAGRVVSERDELVAEVRRITDLLADADSRISKRDFDIETLHKDISIIREKAHEQLQINEKLTHLNATLQDENGQLRAALEELEDSQKQLQDQLDSATRDVQVVSDKVAVLSSSNEKLESQLDESRVASRLVEAERDELIAETSNIEVLLASRNETLQSLRQQIADRDTESAREIAKKSGELAAAAETYLSVRAKLDALTIEHGTLLDKLQNSIAARERVESANEELKRESFASAQRYNQLRTNHSLLQENFRSMSVELTDVTDEMTLQKQENMKLKRVLAVQNTEIDALRSELADIKMSQAQTEQLILDIKKQIKESSRLSDKAEQQRKAESQQVLNGLQDQISRMGATVGQLDRRINHAGVLNFGKRKARQTSVATGNALKQSVMRLARALPGTEDEKTQRVLRWREIGSSIKRAQNDRSILLDMEQLADGRWQDQSAFRINTTGYQFKPLLDISVVLYNSGRWLDKFFAALESVDYPRELIRILLRDHSPDDATYVALEAEVAKRPWLKDQIVYSRGPNSGFGHGHNHNFGVSNTDFFLVCNIDGRFRRNTLSELFAAVATSGDRVAAWELRQVPFEHPKYYDPVTMKTSWVSGASVLFRRSAYLKVGGFDRAIFMYGEDVDLSYRLRGAGYDLAYVPSAIYEHDTYEDAEASFKPLQFHGSTLANVLLRLRFGDSKDILAVPGMWRELARSASVQGQFPGYIKNTFKLAWKAPRFLLTRNKRGEVRIPFTRWDYGLRRDGVFESVGAFHAETPLVSVLVRTYKGRFEMLKHALVSLANQTYRNFEVVVVEDKGDTQKEMTEQFASEIGLNLRYYSCLDEQSNRCRTGTIAMSEAQGEFMVLLDDDDLFFPDHLEYLVSRAIENPEYKAVYSLAWEVGTVKDWRDNTRYREVMHSMVPGMKRSFDRNFLRVMNYIPIQSVLFHRSLFEEYGGFNEELENLEDWELWRRYSIRHDFLYAPKVTSMFHVPADTEVREMRQAKLDEYLPTARRIANTALAKFEAEEFDEN